MSLILLIGMPGAGKTHWGRIWSQAYNYHFTDLDEQIEAQAGMSIPAIFQSVGESGFRALEADVLLTGIAAAARGRNTIMATGGGTPISGSNMETMLKAGCVVYLTATTATLLEHLTATRHSRPLLSSVDADDLDLLLLHRAPFYERAHYQLAVEKISTGTFAQIQNECTNRPL